MDKSSRDTHNTKRSTLQGKTHKATSLVSPSLAFKPSSLHTDTKKKLTSIPFLSSSPSLTESSTTTTHTNISPLKLFTVVHIELDSLSLHHNTEGNTDASAKFFFFFFFFFHKKILSLVIKKPPQGLQLPIYRDHKKYKGRLSHSHTQYSNRLYQIRGGGGKSHAGGR